MSWTTAQSAVARTPLRRVVTGERAFTLLIVAMGVVWVVDGLGYGFTDNSGGVLGPGFFPVISGVPMALLGAAAFVRSFLKADTPAKPGLPQVPTALGAAVAEDGADEQGATTLSEEEEEEGSNPRGGSWAPLFLFAGMAGALILTSWLGLIPALGVMVFLVLTILERQNALKAALIAGAMGFLAWLVFVHFLQVPLSFGELGQG